MDDENRHSSSVVELQADLKIVFSFHEIGKI
jgi:hypothetical protein